MFICSDGLCPVYQLPRCCAYCDESENCDSDCGNHSVNDGDNDCKVGMMEEAEGDVIAFNKQYMSIMQDIAQVVNEKQAAEEKEKRLKDALKKAMEKCGVKSIDNDILKITYIAPTVAVSIDTAKLKKKYPGIADECSKSSQKAGYIKVELKEGVKRENQE